MKQWQSLHWFSHSICMLRSVLHFQILLQLQCLDSLLLCCSFLGCFAVPFWIVDAWDECFGFPIRPGFMYCTCWIPADIEYRITFLCHLECSCILLHGIPSTHCSTLPHGMCLPPPSVLGFIRSCTCYNT
jgi:hypothetical protein